MIMPSASLPISASFLLRQLLRDNEMAGLPRVALLGFQPSRQIPEHPFPGHSSRVLLALIGWVSSTDVSTQICLIAQPGRQD